ARSLKHAVNKNGGCFFSSPPCFISINSLVLLNGHLLVVCLPDRQHLTPSPDDFLGSLRGSLEPKSIRT
ncbi:unnamed protein product, partial [Larinioides sclopetarius]